MTTIGQLREEAWDEYEHDNDMARSHWEAGFKAGQLAEQAFTDPGKRVEALHLVTQTTPEMVDDPVVLTQRYYDFLTHGRGIGTANDPA